MLVNLRTISLYNNHFHGVIPPIFENNTTLENLDFSMNMFSGEIPLNLCFGKRLKILNLGGNQLQSSIPSDLGRCSTLRRLILTDNYLTGLLPEFMKNQNLSFLDISRNSINGTIPSSVGYCTNLSSLDFSMNKLIGPLPDELGNLVELQVLNLSRNHLQGPVPAEISGCTKLYSLDLGYNSLSGSILLSLRALTRLSTLILSENILSGGIPDFFSGFEMLLELQLGGNVLGGPIPSSLAGLMNLAYALNLSNNWLTGQIPGELSGLSKLQRLDISCNNLTGSLEPLIGLALLGGIHSLLELNVSYNRFYGSVPEELMRFFSYPSSFVGNSDICVPYNSSGDINLPSCEHHLVSSKSKDVTTLIKAFGSLISIAMGLLIAIYICFSVLEDKNMKQRPKGWKIRLNLTSLQKKNGTSHRWALGPVVVVTLHQERSRPWSWKLRIMDPYIKMACLAKKKEWYFSHNRLMEATEDMNEKFIIGRGAHGTVYKAMLDDQPFAVKKLVFRGQRGTNISMHREIQIVGQLRHRNLVKLLHFLFRKDYGLIVYEYMSNGSLHDVLHEMSPSPILDWDMRYNIALGTAEGLAYLHNDCVPAVVQQDIKPKNILLDSDMEPKISDFGISKYMDQTRASIQTFTEIGTVGYIAPEIAYTMTKNPATDVYSYGVVLLELLTRKQVMIPLFPEGMNIVNWVHSIWRSTGGINGIVDYSLVREFTNPTVRKEVFEVLVVALRCTEKVPSKRPTMKEVVSRLQNLRKITRPQT
ncbi:hypothetical protein GIB67_022563 [Kingdonia uniflora]|uniref:non-specific serine/threonine protein kinase n=1 Tax=Kingdonia uniflora TaxID=39325 RepID=A0A7J7L7I9_9MAGN|nr:hypothetical protein GIB67_022563 [Kingdonia uniflora]